MKTVVVVDSFKGSLSSNEAGLAVKVGILTAYPKSEVIIVPLADGGEGTIDALIGGMNGERHFITVTGPLNEKVEAEYGILLENKTVIIEMAQASGLPLVPIALRNPLNTTSYGVGEIIKEAINKGCRQFIVGIGGSATNDAGIGMLQALGVEFFNKKGELVGIGGKVLNEIASINTEKMLPELKECHFKVACDVTNPLFGFNGAAYIYGPQKGATEEIVKELDQGLRNIAEVVKKDLGSDFSEVAGVGAAGGLGYAFRTFLNSELKSGVEIIIQETKLENHLKGADFVVTGEGRIDHQTAMGKGPIGIAKLAKKYNAKVIGVAGAVTEDAMSCNDEGIDAFFSIQRSPIPLEKAMDKEVATRNMKATITQIFKLIRATSY